jgi:hypothetical protein
VSVLPAPTGTNRFTVAIGVAGLVVIGGVIIGIVSVYDPSLILGAAQATLWLLFFVWVFRRRILHYMPSTALQALVLGGLAIRVPIVLAHLVVGFLLLGGQVDFMGYFGNASAASLGIFSGDYRRLEMGEDPDVGGWIVTVLYVPVYLLLGSSLFGTFLWSAIIGFMGAFFFLRAFLLHFGGGRHTYILGICLFFYPSVAFWSSLLGKDSWMFCFLGVATYGVAKFIKDPNPMKAGAMIFGTGMALAIRPPIGAIIILGLVVCIILGARRWLAELRGAHVIMRLILFVVVGVAIVVGGYAAVLRPLQRYGVVGEEGGSLVQGAVQTALVRHVGGSAEEGGTTTEASLSHDAGVREIVLFFPQALLTFFFRPHIFEAHNALALIAGVDSTLLILLILLRRRSIPIALRTAQRRPLIAFALTVTVLLSMGLCFETNLGTVVRHRIMVMPFLFMLLCAPPEDATAA